MKFIICLFSAVMVTTSVFCQQNLGIATSNYSCMNSLYLNPANIAESRETKAVNLVSISLGVDNNVGPFNAAQGLVVAVGDGKSNNMFSYSNNSKVSMHAPYVDVTGPGVLFKIDEKHTIAVTTKLRGMNQFNKFDQTVFHTFNDPKFRTTENIRATPKDFTYTVHLWTELGFSYGGVFLDNGVHKIKAGGTVRYLAGLAYVGVQGRSMDAEFTAGRDTFFASNTDIEYASNILHTKSAAGSNVPANLFNILAKGKFGHGLGADFGVVYEYKPEESKLKASDTKEGKIQERKMKANRAKEIYRIRISASVCDIGAIHYNKDKNAVEHFSGSGNVTGPGILDNVKNFQDIQKYAVARGFKADIREEASKVHMPTHLVLGGDYHIQKNYYTNVTFLINLANRQQLGNSYFNQFTVTPRYETRKITVGLPLTYSTLSHRFKAGVGFLAGGFFIGSDDMLALLLKSEYGLSFYTGLNVPLYK